jgi:uncharacterized membrane protein YhaH (DUF805 family)
MMNWYITVLKNYAGFHGRAHRTEYWTFALFNFLILIALLLIEAILGIESIGGTAYGPLSALYMLAVLIPSLAVGARRLHDTGRSGWMQLIPLVSPLVVTLLLSIILSFFGISSSKDSGMVLMPIFVGVILGTAASIWFLALMCQDSKPGPNQYGENPKGITNPTYM